MYDDALCDVQHIAHCTGECTMPCATYNVCMCMMYVHRPQIQFSMYHVSFLCDTSCNGRQLSFFLARFRCIRMVCHELSQAMLGINHMLSALGKARHIQWQYFTKPVPFISHLNGVLVPALLLRVYPSSPVHLTS